MTYTMTGAISEELIRQIKGSSVIALPQSAAKVLELAKNPDNGPPEYAVPISADPGLTAQILKFANSSFFGFRYKITTIQMALSLICVRTVKNFVLWNAVFALLPNPRVGPFNLKCIFQDALRRAVFGKVLAGYFKGLDPEEVFVVGLFQDIAIPVLAQNWPKQYEELLTRLERDGGHLSHLEREMFGWNHADAGAVLVKEWGFSDEFADTILQHATPDFDHIEGTQGLLRSIIRLSAFLPSANEESWSEADQFFSAFHKVVQKRFLGDKGMPRTASLFSEVDLQYEDLLKITKIPSPTQSLVELQKTYLHTFQDDTESID